MPPEFSVVLVEPKVEGNVGAVARSMANFGFTDLVLVNPCPLGPEAYRRAKHGRAVLKRARVTTELNQTLDSVDLAAGTTGIPSTKEDAFHRHALSPWEFTAKVAGSAGAVALLLGREDYGLYNEELGQLDAVINIPCRPEHPVMNLSHAAAIVMYELVKAQAVDQGSGPRLASGFEKERLNDALRELLSTMDYPRHKRRRTEIMFRRLMGRATPSTWEFHTLMGVLRGASKTIRRLSESPARGRSS